MVMGLKFWGSLRRIYQRAAQLLWVVDSFFLHICRAGIKEALIQNLNYMYFITHSVNEFKAKHAFLDRDIRVQLKYILMILVLMYVVLER